MFILLNCDFPAKDSTCETLLSVKYIFINIQKTYLEIPLLSSSVSSLSQVIELESLNLYVLKYPYVQIQQWIAVENVGGFWKLILQHHTNHKISYLN